MVLAYERLRVSIIRINVVSPPCQPKVPLCLLLGFELKLKVVPTGLNPPAALGGSLNMCCKSIWARMRNRPRI